MATGGLPPPRHLLPWGHWPLQGAAPTVTGPGLIIHSVTVIQVAGLEHAASIRCTKGIHPLLLLPVSRQLGTRPAELPGSLLVSLLEIRVAWTGECPRRLRQLGMRQRTPDRLLLGPAWQVLLSQLDIRVAWPGPWQAALQGPQSRDSMKIRIHFTECQSQRK